MADVNKAQAVRDYLRKHPNAKPQEVAAALTSDSIEVNARYVSSVKSQTKSKKTRAKEPRKSKTKKIKASIRQAKYPRL